MAKLEDSNTIYKVFKQNLIDFSSDDINRKKIYENQGFLRKKVDLDYFISLIQDKKTFIYISLDQQGKIIDIVVFSSIKEG